jgi:hypothetical protein
MEPQIETQRPSEGVQSGLRREIRQINQGFARLKERARENIVPLSVGGGVALLAIGGLVFTGVYLAYRREQERRFYQRFYRQISPPFLSMWRKLGF